MRRHRFCAGALAGVLASAAGIDACSPRASTPREVPAAEASAVPARGESSLPGEAGARNAADAGLAARATLPADASDASLRCNRASVVITETALVWLEAGGEEVITEAAAVERLTACRDVLARPKICEPPTYTVCRYRPSPLWLTASRVDHVQAALTSRATALRNALERAGVPVAAPVVLLGDDTLTVYRSRGELGESSTLIPSSFDWTTRWVVRAFIAGDERERHCRDESLGLSREEYAASQRASAAEARRLREGRAARVVELAFERRQGSLVVIAPAPPSALRDESDLHCRSTAKRVPVLVPVPHTRLPIRMGTANPGHNGSF